jgi:hypothetical protein
LNGTANVRYDSGSWKYWRVRRPASEEPETCRVDGGTSSVSKAKFGVCRKCD